MTDTTTTHAEQPQTKLEAELAELANEPSVTITLDGEKDDSPQDGIADMRRQIEAERQRREQAEAQAAQWRQAAEKTSEVAYANAAYSVQKDIDVQMARISQAKQDYRYDDETRATAELQKLFIRQREIEYAQNAANAKQQQPVDVRSAQDAWLQQQDRANRDIIADHRDAFFGDPSKQAKMVAASQAWIHLHGKNISDPGYRDFIEEQAGLRSSAERPERIESRSPTSSAGNGSSRGGPVPAAPPSGNAGTAHYVRASDASITLSAEQRAASRFLFENERDEKGNRIDPETAMARRIYTDYRAGLCDKQGRYYERK